MSSGSLTDVVATISDALSQTTELSPAAFTELKRYLTSYVAKSRKTDVDAASRLQEELLNLFRQWVEVNPTKLGLFMTILKYLRPLIATEAYLVRWFNTAVRSFVHQAGAKRCSIDDAQDFVVGAMVYDDETPDARDRSHTCAKLASLLLDSYMSHTTLPSTEDQDMPLQLKGQATQQLQNMLLAFGRKKAKDLFLAIDKYLLVPNTRFQALGLLAAFVEQQQAHLYLVSQTDVVDHLLTCLMNDTATVVVSAALRCLIMLLPHMPATVVAQLPRLFLIYSRCLCWEKFSASSTKAQRDLVTDERVRRGSGSEYSDESDDDSDLTWPTLHASPDMPESSAPELLHYFTYLYGLYPLNLMSYVRKPRKYLKNIDYPGADHFDLDQAVIRSRTEQFQRVHLLHPALFNTTVEDELVDNRWLKAEPSEVIAECHALYVGQQNLVAPGPPPTVSLPSLPGPPPITSLPSLPVLPALSPSNTRNQTSQSGSRPTSPATSTTSPTRTRQHGTTLLPRESSVLSATDDQSQHDLLDVEGSSTTGGAVPPNKLTTIESTTTLQDVNQLQRELMLLRNELTFERYLKHQHVAAIGQLRRNHIKAVTIEAETATLINANRALQKKLGDAIKFNEKMQKETQARRTHTKQSEELLTTKIRSLKADLADQESIQLKLKQVTKDCEQLRQLLVESEARELGKNKELEQRQTELKQQQEGIEQLQAKAQEAESLRSELSELSRQIRMHRQFEAQIETTRAEQEMTLQELDSVKLLLMHRDQELDRSTRQFQTKTVELETRLQIAQSQAVNSTSINELQAALDDTRFELMQTKKAYTQLLNDYTYIKIKYQELADASCLGLETQSIHSMLPRDPSFSCDYRSQASSVRNQSPMGSRNQHYPDRVLEQVDMYEPQRGHLPPPSSSGNFVPTRPVRPDAYQQQHVVNPGTLSHSSYSSSAALGDSYLYPPAAYNAARSMLGSDYGLMPPAMVRDGRKSAFSVSEDGHSSIENDKIKAKSEVRVYGRGGAQNIKMKGKEKSDKAGKPEKNSKNGGILGLKGIL